MLDTSTALYLCRLKYQPQATLQHTHGDTRHTQDTHTHTCTHTHRDSGYEVFGYAHTMSVHSNPLPFHLHWLWWCVRLSLQTIHFDPLGLQLHFALTAQAMKCPYVPPTQSPFRPFAMMLSFMLQTGYYEMRVWSWAVGDILYINTCIFQSYRSNGTTNKWYNERDCIFWFRANEWLVDWKLVININHLGVLSTSKICSALSPQDWLF